MNKRKIISILSCIVIGVTLILGGCTEGDVDNNSSQATSSYNEESSKDTETIFGNIVEKPVMNGSKTERIGTYAEVMAGGREITKETLIEFYNQVVKDNKYNWVTINIDGVNGIQFSGSVFTYGKIDDEACIVSKVGIGFIIDDKIDYEEVN